jgi:hypothetical protein
VLTWKKLGPAYMASVILDGGQPANLVIVGDSANPKGAALVRKSESGEESGSYFPEAAGLLRPADLIEAYCLQERAFGKRGFPVPVGAE